MAKAVRLAALAVSLLLLLACFAQAAEQKKPAAAKKVTATAKSDEEDNGDSEDEFLEVKVKEVHFNVTPTFKFVLPDTSAMIGIKQKLGDTLLEGLTEYNYLYSKINYMLKYTFELYVLPSFSLYDNIAFERVYEQKKYLQRNKGYAIGLASPKIFDTLVLREELRNEDYYVGQLDDILNVDKGNNLILSTWIEIFVKTGKKKDKDDTYIGVNFEKAIPRNGGENSYLFMNVFFDKYFYPGRYGKYTFSVEWGSLLQNDKVPLWKVYNLGGYDHLLGYRVDEFSGFYKAYFKLRYDRMLFEKIGWELFVVKWKSLNMILIGAAGSAGTVHDLSDLTTYHASCGAGVDLTFVFRDRVDFKLTFVLAQAFRAETMPVLYFIQEL